MNENRPLEYAFSLRIFYFITIILLVIFGSYDNISRESVMMGVCISTIIWLAGETIYKLYFHYQIDITDLPKELIILVISVLSVIGVWFILLKTTNIKQEIENMVASDYIFATLLSGISFTLFSILTGTPVLDLFDKEPTAIKKQADYKDKSVMNSIKNHKYDTSILMFISGIIILSTYKGTSLNDNVSLSIGIILIVPFPLVLVSSLIETIKEDKVIEVMNIIQSTKAMWILVISLTTIVSFVLMRFVLWESFDPEFQSTFELKSWYPISWAISIGLGFLIYVISLAYKNYKSRGGKGTSYQAWNVPHEYPIKDPGLKQNLKYTGKLKKGLDGYGESESEESMLKKMYVFGQLCLVVFTTILFDITIRNFLYSLKWNHFDFGNGLWFVFGLIISFAFVGLIEMVAQYFLLGLGKRSGLKPRYGAGSVLFVLILTFIITVSANKEIDYTKVRNVFSLVFFIVLVLYVINSYQFVFNDRKFAVRRSYRKQIKASADGKVYKKVQIIDYEPTEKGKKYFLK